MRLVFCPMNLVSFLTFFFFFLYVFDLCAYVCVVFLGGSLLFAYVMVFFRMCLSFVVCVCLLLYVF